MPEPTPQMSSTPGGRAEVGPITVRVTAPQVTAMLEELTAKNEALRAERDRYRASDGARTSALAAVLRMTYDEAMDPDLGDRIRAVIAGGSRRQPE